jgi:hypothetical protein
MYFKNIPNIEYDTKPISYPFSNSDYVVAKNFFRRYQVNPDVFSYSVFFRKYAVVEGERIESLAEKAYGDPFLDWIIVLTNNIINPLFDWPMSQDTLRKYCEASYEDPYSEIHHYETYELKNDEGNLVLKGGLIVDEKFYTSPFKYWNGSDSQQVPGGQVSFPVTIFEYESQKNEEKREIYLLRPEYLEQFISDFRKTNLYTESSDYIDNKLKKTGV